MVRLPWRAAALLAFLLVVRPADAAPEPHVKAAPPEQSVALLRDALLHLRPSVSSRDAARLSQRAHTASHELAREYRTVGSAHFQNFLVNIGVRKRGLCFQWTEDLLRQLYSLHLATLQLRWGTAYERTWREHNCVVVAAPGQPFSDGIVLDAWRNSGQLFWARVANDHYRWHEEADPTYFRRATAEESKRADGR